MKYELTVYGFDSGLNELLHNVRFDFRTKRVSNPEKKKNDALCVRAIRSSASLRGVKITKPIIIHYHVFAKDRRRDRTNISSAFDKSFQDALQQCKVLSNDGWEEVINITTQFDLDKHNPRIEIVIEEIENDTKGINHKVHK